MRANASLMREMGSERWLRQLLDALNGDIVTAEEVGFAPSVGTFGYGAPGTSNAQRQGKKKRRKRHHKSDFSVAAVPRCLGTQNDSAVRPGRTNTEGTRGEHAYHIFPAWYRKSDQEE